MPVKLSSTGWLCLGLALAALGICPPAAAEIRPSSDVLLPYFEVDLDEQNRTTLFAVCNGAEEPAQVAVTVFTNWGIPVLEIVRTIDPEAVLTVNLWDWIHDGKLPDRVLSASELVHLRAALSGQLSPRDRLYYSTATVPGRANGYVTMRTRGALRPDSLWGDYFVIDPQQDFAQGETLVNIDPSLELQPACTRHGVRFLEGGSFDSGTEVLIWTDRRGTPSSTPEPAQSLRIELESEVYDESGHVFDERHLRLLPTEILQVGKLGLRQPFGWLDLTTESETFVGVRFNAGNRYSVALHSYCLPDETAAEGPGISLKKLTNGVRATSPPGPSIPEGGVVVWEYVVINTGEVPLTGIRVVDDRVLTVQCPRNALDPGESMTCRADGVAVACQYSNTATATGTPPSGPEVSAYDISHYLGEPRAAIDLEKATNGQDADNAPGPTVPAGTIVSWTYAVTNTGNVPLADVTVMDDRGETVTCPKTSLPPGKSMICTASGVAVSGQYSNIGIARGTTSCSTTVMDEDPSHYFGEEPPSGLTLEKLVNGQDADHAPGPTIPLGSPLFWEYLVMNTGQVAVTQVAVSDDQGVAVSCPKSTLQPGEAMTCTGTGVAAACQYRNVGTASGRTPNGATLTVHDPSHYVGQHHAAIQIEKWTNGLDVDRAPGPEVLAGAPVSWTYRVTNAGDVLLTGVTVMDDRGVAVWCPKNVLQPGETMTCTASGVAVTGQYSNVGIAQGMPPCGQAVSDNDTSYYLGKPGGGQAGNR